LPGFFFVLVFVVLVVLVFVVFVRAFVFVLRVIVVVVIVVVIVESEASHEELCTSCGYEAGSEAGLAFSRLGGGYVDQKCRPQRGHTQN
jgi:hypothetical protein